MPRFINPFTDVGFKRIFGQEINKDLLIDFLNSLLAGEKHITDIHFLDKEVLGETIEDRNSIYDIYCTDKHGEQFIVEMQNRSHKNFRERALFYLSRAIVRQGEKGSKWLFNLKAVYGVFFMNFSLDELHGQLRTDIVLSNRETHEIFTDKMRYVFLQLPAFQKEEDECKTDFERWIYVLKNMETLHRLPFKARKAVFRKLEEIVDIASLSKEDRVKYDESIKVYRDNLVTEAWALEEGKKRGIEIGKEQGKKQGIEIGKKQGIEIGKEQGKEEATIQNARGMKAEGIPIETIAKITGLSIEKIKEL